MSHQETNLDILMCDKALEVIALPVKLLKTLLKGMAVLGHPIIALRMNRIFF